MIKKYIKKRPKTNHFRHPRLNIIPEFMIKVLAIVMLLAALKALIFYLLGKG